MNKDGTLYFTLTSYLVEEDFWASVEYGKGVNAEFSYTSLMCKYMLWIGSYILGGVKAHFLHK